uniref:Uncharacterized protein n=1 Tax=Rhizophora mucronata TaxID=61149 RepID=A0A2P2NIK9_RHIMU
MSHHLLLYINFMFFSILFYKFCQFSVLFSWYICCFNLFAVSCAF